MRPHLSLLLAAALAGLPTAATAEPDCRAESLRRLEAASPNGFAIYRQVTDPEFFAGWLRCDDAQFDLPTAVHETTHRITADTDAFPLIGGGAVARPHEASRFFPPYRIARRFEADDLTKIYLRRGKASSATDFLDLLDEMNAYAHDLATAVDLKALTVADEAVDHRDGLAALMAFVAVYAETARAQDADGSETGTWRGLTSPPVATTLAALWTQGEQVMAASCGIPNFGTRDRTYIARTCAAGPRSAMQQILGRAPVCPTACLAPTPDLDAAGDEAAPAPGASAGAQDADRP